MLLENLFNGLQVVLGRQVKDGIVFVVKFNMGVDVLQISANEVLIKIPMRAEMSVRIHRYKAGVLEETWVNTSSCPGVLVRDFMNQVFFKPLNAVGFGQIVDLGGAKPRIDWATHHGHRTRDRFVLKRRQDREGRQNRHRRLADRDHMQIGAKAADELNDVGDVIIEVKGASGQRHHSGIKPVGHVDLVSGKHGADGVAQQRRMVARERCNNQNGRVTLAGRHGVRQDALEFEQTTKRFDRLDALENRNFNTIDQGAIEPPGRLVVVFPEAMQEFEPCRIASRHRHVGKWAVWVGVELGDRVRPVGERIQQRTLHFTDLIEHRRNPCPRKSD